MPTFRIEKDLLGKLLFGNDEIIVCMVYDNNPYIDIEVAANPDLGLDEGTYIIEFRSEMRIVRRDYKKV